MKRMRFVLLPILLIGLISCGTNQSSSSSHPVNAATEQIDPCSLVSKAQVEQILKAQVTLTQEPSTPNSKTIQYAACDYASWDFSASAAIGLEIYKDVASARAAFEDHQHKIVIVSLVVDGTPPPTDVHITHQNISDLGDQAFLIIGPQFPMLYVQKDNIILSITAGNYGQSVAQAEKQEQELAQIAVRNM